jgi:hypothetical protein
VSLWLSIARENNHRDTEDAEVAQRRMQIRTSPEKILVDSVVNAEQLDYHGPASEHHNKSTPA